MENSNPQPRRQSQRTARIQARQRQQEAQIR